jgi:hypothetical protein
VSERDLKAAHNNLGRIEHAFLPQITNPTRFRIESDKPIGRAIQRT